MNTPAHLIFGLAAFGKPGKPALITAALTGALVPDASLYLLAGKAIYLDGISPRIVFDQMYYSAEWQAIFAVDNSIVIWSLLLVLGVFLRRAWVAALAGSALLHLIADFALHNDHARRHFWPLSDWVFVSPVSYWDGAHYGDVVGMIEVALVLALSIWMLFRFTGWITRTIIVLLCAAQMAPFLVWRLMF